jgi:hypothetical protein
VYYGANKLEHIRQVEASAGRPARAAVTVALPRALQREIAVAAAQAGVPQWRLVEMAWVAFRESGGLAAVREQAAVA